MRQVGSSRSAALLRGFPRLRAGTFIEAEHGDVEDARAAFPRLRAGTFIEADRRRVGEAGFLKFPRLRAGTFIEAKVPELFG